VHHLQFRSTSAILLLAALCLAAPSGGCGWPEFDPQPALRASRSRRGRKATRLEAVLALPENELDLGRAAVLIAAELRPGLDVEAECARLDRLTADAARQIGRGGTAREAVGELNSLLLVRSGLAYYRARGERDFDVSDVLRSRRGNCLSCTLLYLAVAQRLGLPVRAVSAPGHVFMRYDDGQHKFNIEPTLAGRRITDLRYRITTNVSAVAEKRGLYLRALSHREFLAEVLAARGGLWARVGKPARARRDLDLALAVLPDSPQAGVNRGYLAEQGGRIEEALGCYRRVLRVDPTNPTALNNLAGILVADRKRPEYDPQRAAGLVSEALKGPRRADPTWRAALLDTAGRVAAARARWREAAKFEKAASKLAPQREDYRRRAEEYARRAAEAKEKGKKRGAPAGGGGGSR
jgi:regulator of sirC expression with transglutaminase-like and TPR domain